ncbi:PCI domain-containing protein 2 [Podochytrium sp. JEL0797]|nr:PCI domain-containing protein 2 [Podochytrium sp. JEL0797]
MLSDWLTAFSTATTNRSAPSLSSLLSARVDDTFVSEMAHDLAQSPVVAFPPSIPQDLSAIARLYFKFLCGQEAEMHANYLAMFIAFEAYQCEMWHIDVLRVVCSDLVMLAFLDPNPANTLRNAVKTLDTFPRLGSVPEILKSRHSSTPRGFSFFIPINASFKICFALNELTRCPKIIEQVDLVLRYMSFSDFAPQEVVTFNFWLGRFRLGEGDFGGAEESLEVAWGRCPEECFGQRRQILIYLTITRLVLGYPPSRTLLTQYNLDDLFNPIIESIQAGHYAAFEYHVAARQTALMRYKCFGVVRDRTKVSLLRNLLRKVYRIQNQPHSIMFHDFMTACQVSGMQECTIEDAECEIQALVDAGFVQGYINHVKRNPRKSFAVKPDSFDPDRISTLVVSQPTQKEQHPAGFPQIATPPRQTSVPHNAACVHFDSQPTETNPHPTRSTPSSFLPSPQPLILESRHIHTTPGDAPSTPTCTSTTVNATRRLFNFTRACKAAVWIHRCDTSIRSGTLAAESNHPNDSSPASRRGTGRSMVIEEASQTTASGRGTQTPPLRSLCPSHGLLTKLSSCFSKAAANTSSRGTSGNGDLATDRDSRGGGSRGVESSTNIDRHYRPPVRDEDVQIVGTSSRKAGDSVRGSDHDEDARSRRHHRDGHDQQREAQHVDDSRSASTKTVDTDLRTLIRGGGGASIAAVVAGPVAAPAGHKRKAADMVEKLVSPTGAGGAVPSGVVVVERGGKKIRATTPITVAAVHTISVASHHHEVYRCSLSSFMALFLPPAFSL